MDQEPGKVTPASTAPSSATTDEIRSQIEQTRADMSDTLDAIQDRLRPGRLVSSATEKVKDATIGRVKTLTNRSSDGFGNGRGAPINAERAVQLVKANPVPAALLGTAAALAAGAWLRSRNRSSYHPEVIARRVPRTGSFALGRRNRRALVIGACAGIACWATSRTGQFPRFRR